MPYISSVNTLRILCLLLLCSTTAMAQKVLPLEALRPLKVLMDSLDYVVEAEFEKRYILDYGVDSGYLAINVEKFHLGTYTKTPDQYLTWFKLSDIDPSTIAFREDGDGLSLILFTANNKRTIYNSIYVEKELAMQSESYRLIVGFWQKDADRALLLKIREELIRLILLAWEGKPPTYETDIHNPAKLFINGEEVIWQEGPLPKGAAKD